MKFKGDIIITDPCYIIKPTKIKHPSPVDFNLPESICSKPFDQYSTENEFAYKKACDDYYILKRNQDDWEKCDYGDDMEVLGINNYMCNSTIYGDWSCTTYKTDENPKELIDRIAVYNEEDDDGERIAAELGELDDIGEFCADAGMVAVFLLDEILKYNPEFSKWINEHNWCVTKIDNFDGDIEYYIDSENNAHIYGVGNVNFATFQTGL